MIDRLSSDLLIAAPSLRQAGEFHRKCTDLLGKLSARPALIEDSASTIALANGSCIVCVPATEATSRGFSAPSLIVMDKASRIADESVAALRPMLASGCGLSTSAGQRGHFFEAATTHAVDWQWHTVRATDIQRISPDFLDAERRAIGPRAFAQEYMCAFEATDAALFDLETINACLDSTVIPLFAPGGSASVAADFAVTLSGMRPLGLA